MKRRHFCAARIAALSALALTLALGGPARADACDKLTNAEAFNACLANEGPAARAVEADLAAQKNHAPLKNAPAAPNDRPPAENSVPRSKQVSAPMSKQARPKRPAHAAAPRSAVARPRGRVRLEIIPGQ